MSLLRFGAVIWMKEPSASVKLNVVAPTVSDSTVAEEPEMLIVMSLTLNTASVVKVTSVAAAIANAGSISAIPDPIAISFLMTCGC